MPHSIDFGFVDRNSCFSLALLAIVFCYSFNSALAQGVRVEDLKFKGNEAISSGKLERAIQTQANPWYRFFIPWMNSKIYDDETFLTDLLRVEKFYQKEGYLQAKVSNYELNYSDDEAEVSIVVYIDEGEPTLVDEVTFDFEPDSSRGLIPDRIARAMKLKKGKRYREEDLRLDYDKIIERFSDNAHPYIEVRVRPTIYYEKHTVNLEWLLNPGPFCRFGEIQYKGNQHVSDKAIRRGLGFSQGDFFSQKKLTTAQSQVYRLELFQFVSLKATDLDDRPRDIPIEVRVKEATLRTLKFGLGYGSEENFRGFAQWRHRNFLGGARILRINAKRSTAILPLELEAELSQPYFLSNRNDLILKPFFKLIREKSFRERSIGAELTLNRRLTRNTSASFTTIVEKDTIELNPNISDPISSEQLDKSKSIFRIGLAHNTSNQFFTPTKGSISSVQVEDGGRFISTPSKYLKVFSEHRSYFTIGTSVFALKVAAGSMKAINGSIQTPVEERFFSGGSYSVRGWERQLLGPLQQDMQGNLLPLGGDSIIEGGIEMRRPVFKQLGTAFFLDYGNVWEKWNGFDLLGLHYALGVGLRYNTVIGPVRVDFAWKLNKQKLDERNYAVHISIGQAF